MFHLVVIGFDEIVSNKYITCIEEAIHLKAIDGYSVIDLEQERPTIEARVQRLQTKPENVYYLSANFSIQNWTNKEEYQEILGNIIKNKKRIKVYIAAELKAHEGYLTYCVENSINCLVEKPVLAPMSDRGFDCFKIDTTMTNLAGKAAKNKSSHSVMTLGRYHSIYNDLVLGDLKKLVIKHHAPVTSFHLRAAGGVWNLHDEYESRDDHPYKYGYGMLMHGAYHYIDIASQFIDLNRIVYPTDPMTMTVSSYAAYPYDQNDRISKKFSSQFNDNKLDMPIKSASTGIAYGENDVVTSFCIQNAKSGKTITLGTLSFEQTTPSIRSWKKIPKGLYNKNGRTSRVDIEAQLATLHAVNVECYDVPVKENDEVDRIDAFARVTTRTNAALLPEHEYVSSKTYSGLFHSDSNKNLMLAWLTGSENRSSLASHLIPMRILEALTVSIKSPGKPVSFEL